MADELYIGLISGTSIDAIDVALVDLASTNANTLKTYSHPIPENIRQEILSLCTPSDNEIERMAIMDNKLGILFSEAVNVLLRKANLTSNQINAIGSHGQTIRHYPPNPENEIAFTLQIGNPNIIAEQTGITTVADFRRHDMAVKGHGAPLVPAFHATFLGSVSEYRVIVNIGGISNITILDNQVSEIAGFDTGPGNVLMDYWSHVAFNKSHDHDGEIASQGKVNSELLNKLSDDDYFKQQPPKSSGREYFNLSWLRKYLGSANTIPKQDIMTTLSELTAISISNAIKEYANNAQHVLVCGGGVHNTWLMQRLKANLQNLTVDSTKVAGVDPDFVEAIAFAWLAKQTMSGKPGNVAKVTGAEKSVILGGIYQV